MSFSVISYGTLPTNRRYGGLRPPPAFSDGRLAGSSAGLRSCCGACQAGRLGGGKVGGGGGAADES